MPQSVNQFYRLRRFFAYLCLLTFCLHPNTYSEEIENPFLKLRQQDIESKDRKIKDMSNEVAVLQRQLEQEREQIRQSQEKIWQEFSNSLEMERKNLKDQMEAIDSRQRLFENEFKRKQEQDDVRLQEKSNEIRRMMMSVERLEAEMIQDRKNLELQQKEHAESQGKDKQIAAQERNITVQQSVLEDGTIKIAGLSGRQLLGQEAFNLTDVRPEYYLEIGDTIGIEVWRVPELTKIVTVRPDGRISLPLVGDLDVVGLNLVELRELISRKISDYVREPQVSISIQKFGGRKFIILGMVESPGVYRYEQDITLIEGIALAGGFQEDAKKGKVSIIRGDINKQPQVRIITANMENVLKRGMISENLTILPNDIIYVGKDMLGDYNEMLENFWDPTLNSVINFFVLRSAIRTAQKRSA